MTFVEKLKQMYTSVMLERNPYYYCIVDIQKCISDLKHLMDNHKLDRGQMREATFYLTSLREYKNVVSFKTDYSRKVPMKDVVVDIYMQINSVQRFIEDVIEEEHKSINDDDK